MFSKPFFCENFRSSKISCKLLIISPVGVHNSKFKIPSAYYLFFEALLSGRSGRWLKTFKNSSHSLSMVSSSKECLGRKLIAVWVSWMLGVSSIWHWTIQRIIERLVFPLRAPKSCPNYSLRVTLGATKPPCWCIWRLAEVCFSFRANGTCKKNDHSPGDVGSLGGSLWPEVT